MDFLFFQKSYLCYKFKAKDEYSLHSPFMFDFFVNGLKTSCKNSEIIFVPELEKRIPKAKSLRKFLFKTFRYLKSKEMELLYIDSESFVKENLEQIMACNLNTAVVIEGIHKNKLKNELWKSLQANENFKICCDFFSFGIIFLTDKPLKKQNYILRKK